MLQFVYEPDASHAAVSLSDRLSHELDAGKRVAWFLCGGSNIPLCVQVMAALPADKTDQLTILLTDERYGVPGHADSNWKQLYDAGFLAGKARIIETLQPELTLQDTCTAYATKVRHIIEQSDVVIAQFGIGGDGHIAGILPRSQAVNDQALVTGYDAGTFMRITLTPPFWQHITAAFALVYGENKYTALSRLKNQDISIDEQPAQLLKTIPEAYVYTDQKIAENSQESHEEKEGEV